MTSPILRPRILDLGCGEGIKIQRFSPHALYVGVDLDFPSVQKIQDRKPDGFAAIARAEALPFKDNVFDEIHAYDVLEHVQDFEASCAQISRCLKQGGMLVIEVPHHRSELVLLRAHPEYWTEISHRRFVRLEDLVNNFHSFRVRRFNKKRGVQHLFLWYHFRHGGRITSERGACSNARHSVERIVSLFDEDYLETYLRQRHAVWSWLLFPVLLCAYIIGKGISMVTPKTMRVELTKEH